MDITEKLRVYERTPSPFLQSVQFSRPAVADLLKTMICNILYRNLQLEPVKILDASQTFLLKEFCVRYGLSVLTMYFLPPLTFTPFICIEFIRSTGTFSSSSAPLSFSTSLARILFPKPITYHHLHPGSTCSAVPTASPTPLQNSKA